VFGEQGALKSTRMSNLPRSDRLRSFVPMLTGLVPRLPFLFLLKARSVWNGKLWKFSVSFLSACEDIKKILLAIRRNSDSKRKA
jgi:hypothetical protein